MQKFLSKKLTSFAFKFFFFVTHLINHSINCISSFLAYFPLIIKVYYEPKIYPITVCSIPMRM